MWLATPAIADNVGLQGGRVSEYELKASVLFNLVRFTEWPARSFPSAKAPYVVCVVGVDPFGAALNTVFDPLELNKRRFRIQRIGGDESTLGCHLAFVNGLDADRVHSIVAGAAEKPTLTVGETPGFIHAGGMVMLFTEGARVRFTINGPAVHAGGLRMSSLLLGLSRLPAGATISKEHP